MSPCSIKNNERTFMINGLWPIYAPKPNELFYAAYSYVEDIPAAKIINLKDGLITNILSKVPYSKSSYTKGYVTYIDSGDGPDKSSLMLYDLGNKNKSVIYKQFIFPSEYWWVRLKRNNKQ